MKYRLTTEGLKGIRGYSYSNAITDYLINNHFTGRREYHDNGRYYWIVTEHNDETIYLIPSDAEPLEILDNDLFTL